jgi:hypothetical protein
MRNKKTEPKKTKKLEVRKERIRNLSQDELTSVAGGFPRPYPATRTGNCY